MGMACRMSAHVLPSAGGKVNLRFIWAMMAKNRLDVYLGVLSELTVLGIQLGGLVLAGTARSHGETAVVGEAKVGEPEGITVWGIPVGDFLRLKHRGDAGFCRPCSQEQKASAQVPHESASQDPACVLEILRASSGSQSPAA